MSGKYRTIVADPPWDYGSDHKRWPSSPTRKNDQAIIHASIPYEAMTNTEIAGLPVAECVARDARLFVWTTNKHLPFAFPIISAWGFEYRQTLLWRKTGNPSPFGGSIAPNHAEFLLVGVRGKPPISERLASSVVECPAAATPGQHSAKPDVFLDLVEQVSPGPYLELFARRARFGWDYWGDERLDAGSLSQQERPPAIKKGPPALQPRDWSTR